MKKYLLFYIILPAALFLSAQNPFNGNIPYGKVMYKTYFISPNNDTLLTEHVALDYTNEVWPADSQQNILLDLLIYVPFNLICE